MYENHRFAAIERPGSGPDIYLQDKDGSPAQAVITLKYAALMTPVERAKFAGRAVVALNLVRGFTLEQIEKVIRPWIERHKDMEAYANHGGIQACAYAIAERLHKKNTATHDNLLDVAVNGVTEGERLESLARWLEQQHFRPDVMSIAAADLRALYRRAKDVDQATQHLVAKIAEQDAVITQRNAECSWKHHELAKLAEVIDRLVGGLEWSLNEIGMEPFEHCSGDNADAHRAALQSIKDARAQLGQDAIERAVITGSSLPPEAFEPPKGGDA